MKKERKNPRGKGLIRYGKNKTPYKQDLFGEVFGHILVFEYDGQDPNGQNKWWCLCTLCNSYKSILGASLMSGRTKTCGCSNIKHGLTRGPRNCAKPPEYKSWIQIKDRTGNENSHAWKDYGGRGIKICDGWKNDFAQFFKDVGPKPDKKLSLNRKNNHGNYSCGHCEECVAHGWPMNCKWDTDKNQARNRRSSRIYEIGGVKKTVAELAETYQVSYKTIWNWLKKYDIPTVLSLLQGK